jgi:hypothetical protein
MPAFAAEIGDVDLDLQALEKLTDEKHSFNNSLAAIAREQVRTKVPTQRKAG